MAFSPSRSPVVIQDGVNTGDAEIEPLAPSDPQDPSKPAHFDYITENVYISHSLQTSKDRKRSKRMVCECQFDPETDEPDEACGESCLNRLLMIECGSRCPCREYCTNKKFQRAEYAKVEVFKTEKKGWGLRALEHIAAGTFIMEYCGEVCSPADFEKRKIEYVKEKRRHYYFMSLTTDEILDATRKGNMSRYINHSCDPNSETQKWTVNGKLRIGFFSLRDIEIDDELTFDYKFQRFGDVAQKCYCGSANCRGYLGQTKQTPATLKVINLDREAGSPRSPSSSRRRPRQRIQSDADSAFEKELYDIVGSSWRLKSNNQVLAFCRLMLQAESPSQRIMLLQVLQATDDVFSKKFISFHGLRLLWSWMVDSSDFDSPEGMEFRIQVLQTLERLPIANKNQLDENKILPVVRRWAEHGQRGKQSSGEESVSSQQLPSSSDEQPETVNSQQQPSSSSDDLLERTIVTEADSVGELVTDPERGVVKISEGVAMTEEGDVTVTEERGVAVEEETKNGKESTVLGKEEMTLTDERGVAVEEETKNGKDSTVVGEEEMTLIDERGVAVEEKKGVAKIEEDSTAIEEGDTLIKERGVALSEEMGVAKNKDDSTMVEEGDVTMTEEGGVDVAIEKCVAIAEEGDVFVEKKATSVMEEGDACLTEEGSVATKEEEKTTTTEEEEEESVSVKEDGGMATVEGRLVTTERDNSIMAMTEEGVAMTEEGVAITEGGVAISKVGVAMTEGGAPITEDVPVTEGGVSTPEGMTERDAAMADEGSVAVTERVVAMSEEHNLIVTDKVGVAASVEGEGSSKAETREADSVCEIAVESKGALSEEKQEEEGRTVKEEEESSREAEAREQSTSDQSQDEEGQSSIAREKLSSMAEELLKKWETLKEVFRIPKRTPLRTKLSPRDQRTSLMEDELKEGEEMDDEEVLPSRKNRHRNKERQSSSQHSSPRDRRADRQFDHQPDRSWSRSWKGLLPTPKRSLHTSSPSQRIPHTSSPSQRIQAKPPPIPVTTPTINPALAHPLPSTVAAGFAPGGHTHTTYTASFAGNAPVQNTVIVQQPGQSIYVQQQVFQDGLKTTILPTQYAPPTQHPQHPAPQQYVQLNPAHLPPLPPLPVTAYAPLTQQRTGGVPVPPAVVTTPSFVPSSAPPPNAAVPANVATLQPQFYQQHQQQQVLLQSSASSSLMTGTPLLAQQPTPAFNNTLTLAPLPPPPPNEDRDLPLNWKTARDTDGKVYYYHAITRKTQWERPTEKDVEGTITMDLGTPEPESDSEQDVDKSIPRGPRTPPDNSEGYGGEPHTPEGTPPPIPKGHKGPRTPSPKSYTSPQLKTHRKRRHRHSRVKGPRTPSPPRHRRRRSKSSSKSSISPVKSSHSPSPHPRPHKPEHHTPLTSTTVLSPKSLPSPQTIKSEGVSVAERLAKVLGSTESQVEKSVSHSPTSKSDTLKLHSPLSIPPTTSVPPDSQQSSTPQEHTPLNMSLLNESTASEGQDELTPPPRKKHRGEGKVKSKSSKAKDEYRHRLSKVVIHCLDQHRKSDCKYGRITCADDFKYLARKLTYGLAEKEFNRKGSAGVGKLELTDSVKAKVKDYIRQYMKKFGSVYVRTSSP